MTITATRAQRRQLERDNAKIPAFLHPLPKEQWPSGYSSKLIKVWRSRGFLVQAFDEGNAIRLSVNRTTLGDNGRWVENITWDELQELKRQCGFADWYAIEVYPRDKDVVNVANMRHLWVLQEPLNVGWMKP